MRRYVTISVVTLSDPKAAKSGKDGPLGPPSPHHRTCGSEANWKCFIDKWVRLPAG